MLEYQDFIGEANGLVYLSTAHDNTPSSRLVSFAVDDEDQSIWYVFSMDVDSPKVYELNTNPNVAVITPIDLKNGMRMSSNRATMTRSDKSWADVRHLFEESQGFMKAHDPENELLFEIHFKSLVLQNYNPAATTVVEF
ncbi:MAG: pyridoxamine 5'-phosphate oxidase family protein [Lactobacillaceae bacterium]|jgi:general stress protein 26|nr:pyridoxamine 5'-phosphate oxidase family protein [Lactobacillaceae bacterium]